MGVRQSNEEKFKDYMENKVLTSIYPPPSEKSVKTKSRNPIKPTKQNGQEVVLQAFPSEGNIEHIISAFDGRKPVESPSKWPNSAHGVVTAKFEGAGGKLFGTGTLIGPNIVLTAGHNLYDPKKKVFALLESIQFLPGIDGQKALFGIAEIEQYFVSPSYVEENKEDYGILVLKEPIGEKTDYFGLACPNPEELKEKMINVTGYPWDKGQVDPPTYEMWGMGGLAFNVDSQKGVIQYQIDTAGGQSGSGVWYQEEEDYYVCGVHVEGSLTFNQATLLTESIYQQIHSWLQQIANKNFFMHLGDTREIKFKDFTIDASCVSHLMRYNLENLTHLDLACQGIGKKGAIALAKNTSWTNLSHLDLSSNDIGTEGAEALATNTSWVNLLWLNLSKNSIQTHGARKLTENSFWVKLSHLDLSQNEIDAEGSLIIMQNKPSIGLSQLDLRNNRIHPEATGVSGLISKVTLNQTVLVVSFGLFVFMTTKALQKKPTEIPSLPIPALSPLSFILRGILPLPLCELKSELFFSKFYL